MPRKDKAEITATEKQAVQDSFLIVRDKEIILTISTEKQPAKQTRVSRIRKLTSETHTQTFYKEGDSPNGMSSSNVSSQSSWNLIKVEVEREEEPEGCRSPGEQGPLNQLS